MSPAEAVQELKYHQWLEHPATKDLFSSLEARRLSILEQASKASVVSAADEKQLRLQLVKAETIREIIEAYARRNTNRTT